MLYMFSLFLLFRNYYCCITRFKRALQTISDIWSAYMWCAYILRPIRDFRMYFWFIAWWRSWSTVLLVSGSYPNETYENVTMTACVVKWGMDCYYSWNVPVMKCEDFNVVYLEPAPFCGRYCMGWYQDKYFGALIIHERKHYRKSK